jgi:hypothetical protein
MSGNAITLRRHNPSANYTVYMIRFCGLCTVRQPQMVRKSPSWNRKVHCLVRASKRVKWASCHHGVAKYVEMQKVVRSCEIMFWLFANPQAIRRWQGPPWVCVRYSQGGDYEKHCLINVMFCRVVDFHRRFGGTCSPYCWWLAQSSRLRPSIFVRLFPHSANSSTLKMAAERSSETSENIYQTTRYNISQVLFKVMDVRIP